MAKRINDKINYPTNFTSPKTFAVLLDAVKNAGTLTSESARTDVFPKARSAVSRYDPTNNDTHGEGTLRTYGLIENLPNTDPIEFRISALGRRFLECFERDGSGKYVLKANYDYNFNSILLDALLYWTDTSGARKINPGWVLLKLLNDKRLDCYITDYEWAYFCELSDYRNTKDYDKLVNALVELRSSDIKEHVQLRNAYVFLVGFSGDWDLLDRKTENGFNCFTLKEMTMRNLQDKLDAFSTYSNNDLLLEEEIPAEEFPDEAPLSEETVCTRKTLPTLSKRRKTDDLNSILYGAPGTGKTYATAQYALAIVEGKSLADVAREPRDEIMKRYNALVNEGQVVFTTFHQNYGYEDFIQGIRPDTSTSQMHFKTVDGVFKTIADKAMGTPSKDFIIIIDEINRANISKVFGELITLIEDDKRWGEENAVSVTLPSGEIFAVPNNLYIIGTMNSADKSISLIDTALRRRFAFVEFIPRLELIADDKLRAVLEKLNTGISRELNSTDLLIGHSYFINKREEDICKIMNRSIIPLLYEYFFDNSKKVEAQLKNALEGLDVEIDSNAMGRITVKQKEV